MKTFLVALLFLAIGVAALPWTPLWPDDQHEPFVPWVPPYVHDPVGLANPPGVPPLPPSLVPTTRPIPKG